ncbi:MAG TPA: ATP-grasp domain-containing protein [Candidatus Polarisedimenticolia bacterium]|nr:ATP-grasp domain-containing protein [Candidatus Polarisedimenticolia bacterium]
MGGDAARPGAEDRPPAAGLPRLAAARLHPDGGQGLRPAARSEPKRVLLLLPTNTYRAHDFLEAARQVGVETVVGSDRRQTLEDLAPARLVTLDLHDPETAAAQIARFAAAHPLDAVIPTDDESAEVAARASALLGLPHNPPEAARAARHKDELRRLLRAAGVRTPRAHPLRPDADPVRLAREQSYPCVLKPTFLAASRGVIRADDEEQFVAAFRRIAALVALPEVAERARGIGAAMLVEEFVPGAEVALEGILAGGRLKTLAIFDKPDPLDGPFFEETIYVTPSRHPEATQRALEATTAAAAAALGLREGPVHAELRVNDLGPWLIELAARSIGGLCSRTLRFGAGISLEALILMHAVGRGVEEYNRERQAAGVMMIPVPRAGILKEVRGLQEARRVSGIVDITISATLGRPLVPLPEGNAYPGFVFGRGASPEEVEAALREAHRRLTFVVEPDESRRS